jgi:hypothetical protein
MNQNQLRNIAENAGVPIKTLSAQTMAQLISAPQAQLRTANYKKAVKIVEDLVFKGPYTSDKDFFRLMENLKYTHALELLEAALQLNGWQRGSLRWKFLGCWDDDQYYLVMPNVGKWKGFTHKRDNTKIEKNVKVVRRKTHIMRVSDIEGTELLTDDIKSAALQHLYLRFLLDIGDSGTHNILTREDHSGTGRLIAGIDLEEKITDNVKVKRSKEKKRRLNLLFKSGPFPKHISLYQSGVCKIKSLYYSQLYQHTLGRLRAVGIDLERLKDNMKLWMRTPI